MRRVRCEEREVMGLVAKAEEALRRGFHGGRELGPDSQGARALWRREERGRASRRQQERQRGE